MLVVVAGCATREASAPASGTQPPGYPARDYDRAIADGKAVYRVDPAHSTVVIEVRRAGSLARLGHDHVVAGYDIRGYVMPDSNRADLYLALDTLVVDEARLRAQAGFDTEPTADAIAGTRRNMLNRVLEAERFPFAVISVDALDAERVAAVSITLHGTTRTMRIPLQVDASPDEWLVAGAFAPPAIRKLTLPSVNAMSARGMPMAFWAGTEREPIQAAAGLSRSTSMSY